MAGPLWAQLQLHSAQALPAVHGGDRAVFAPLSPRRARSEHSLARLGRDWEVSWCSTHPSWGVWGALAVPTPPCVTAGPQGTCSAQALNSAGHSCGNKHRLYFQSMRGDSSPSGLGAGGRVHGTMHGIVHGTAQLTAKSKAQSKAQSMAQLTGKSKAQPSSQQSPRHSLQHSPWHSPALPAEPLWSPAPGLGCALGQEQLPLHGPLGWALMCHLCPGPGDAQLQGLPLLPHLQCQVSQAPG